MAVSQTAKLMSPEEFDEEIHQRVGELWWQDHAAIHD
jgi:hypothetical protein